MDEETAKAIQEAMSILHVNAEGHQEPGTTPAFPMPCSLVDEQEQPEGDAQKQHTQDEPPPTVTEPGTSEVDTSIHPASNRRWLGIAGLIVAVISLTLIVMLVIVPLFRPTAIVTIIPVQTAVTVSGTVQVTGRALPTVTLTQARTVPATGTGHQDAQAAQGSVTFYNGYTEAQALPAGTLLQTASGVQIVTDQSATVPPASPPTQGQATVPAHALETGPAGNIKAYSIYGACCRAYILAANTAAFTGGQDARSFRMVTQSDMDNVVTPLKTSLMQSVQAALQAQLRQGEALAPASCIPTISSDHKAGEEAAQVSVTLTDSCTGYAYPSQDAQTQVIQSLTDAARQQLGDGYSMTGDPQITLLDSSAKGTLLTLRIKAQGAMAYQFGQGQLQALKNHLAGMNKAEATAWLARQPGIKAVSIDVSAGATLPQDTSAIRCTVLYAG